MRRRKPRVVWLPQTNANSIGDGTKVYQAALLGLTGPTGTANTLEIPLVLDAQQGLFDIDSSLSDIESSGYRLRRIVGKIWIQCAQTPIQGDSPGGVRTPITAFVTAGIIVRRADSLTGASLAQTADPTGFQTSPAEIENTGDPWVWRRSWLLQNNGALDNLVQFNVGDFRPLNVLPALNWGVDGASAVDGPHVDQKTARIVATEERLFLDVTATVFAESGDPDNEQALQFAVVTDLRVLGSLRTTVGNRRNASR